MRAIVVTLMAVAVAAGVVRLAGVRALAERAPVRAASIWPGHPDVVLSLGLVEVGDQAARGQAVTSRDIQPLLDAARSAPLAPEPFLVRGVQLRLAGEERAAGRAFAQALHRNPRSIPSRYFLADHHLRVGAVSGGLGEVAAIARLMPGSAEQLSPVLATYAKAPGAIPPIRAMLARHPKLEPSLLHTLAADPANAPLILSLARRPLAGTGDRPAWHNRLVEAMFAAGNHAGARRLWAELTGEPPASGGSNLLFDAGFARPRALPPFAWRLESGAGGLVEPQGGGLHVIYYGRETMPLASQALMLGAGPYQLRMKLAGGGEAAEALVWTLTCLPSNADILTLPLAGGGIKVAGFAVPARGCSAQRLALGGRAPDFPQTVDLVLTDLTLTRGNAR